MLSDLCARNNHKYRAGYCPWFQAAIGGLGAYPRGGKDHSLLAWRGVTAGHSGISSAFWKQLEGAMAPPGS